MTNNDVLRRVRYIFDFTDQKMHQIYECSEQTVAIDTLNQWLQKDDTPNYLACDDQNLANFLNGFINDQRGKKEGAQPTLEKKINNNGIFRKLKIALNLKNDDVLEILSLADFKLSKHELSALFRKSGHKNYRECKDQILRNFLMGLQLKHRPDTAKPKTEFQWKPLSS